jgi:hypothetical protein
VILIWVTDPIDNRILDFGKIYQGTDFEFTAERDGAHTLNFDNPLIFLERNDEKIVTMTYSYGSSTMNLHLLLNLNN